MLHGLVVTNTDEELEAVQFLVETAKHGFPNKTALSTFTTLLIQMLAKPNTFEATFFLIYFQGQTEHAT